MLRSEADQRPALQLSDLLTFRQRLRHGLAVHLAELRLIVERFKMRRSACLIKKDDTLRSRGMMKRVYDSRRPRTFGRHVSREKRVQRNHAETRKALP